MILKICIAIVCIVLLLIDFKFSLNINKLKKDTTISVISSTAPITLIIFSFLVGYFSLFTLFNIFTESYTTSGLLISIWWILCLPFWWKQRNNTYIILGNSYIKPNFKKEISFDQIKDISYENLSSDSSLKADISIILTLTDNSTCTLKLRQEDEALKLYNKLLALPQLSTLDLS